MSFDVVGDSSTVVALLLDAGPDGRWAADILAGARLLAPSLMMFEAGNIIRRHELAGLVSADQAVQAHVDLLALSIEQWPVRAPPRECGNCARISRPTTPATSPSPNSPTHRWSHSIDE